MPFRPITTAIGFCLTVVHLVIVEGFQALGHLTDGYTITAITQHLNAMRNLWKFCILVRRYRSITHTTATTSTLPDGGTDSHSISHLSNTVGQIASLISYTTEYDNLYYTDDRDFTSTLQPVMCPRHDHHCTSATTIVGLKPKVIHSCFARCQASGLPTLLLPHCVSPLNANSHIIKTRR